MGFIFLFFFMEETNYSRHSVLGVASAESSPATVPAALDSEKSTIAPSGNDAKSDLESPAPTPSPSYKQKTYLDKIKLFQAADLRKPNRIGGMMLRPLIFLSFPIIFYAGFSYGSNLVWFNVLNGTASLILGGTYNFPSSMVGLSYLSPLIGVAIGSIYTGPIGDRIVLKLARKNKGILEPEQRLWLFIPSLLLIPFGLILWGVGAAHHGKPFHSHRKSTSYADTHSSTLVRLRLCNGRHRTHKHTWYPIERQLRHRLVQRPQWRSHGYRHPGAKHHVVRHWVRLNAVGRRHGLAERIHLGWLCRHGTSHDRLHLYEMG